MTWNKILKRPEYSLQEPDKLAVQFVEFLKKKHSKRVLDLGCGAGRHVIYFSKQGFETYGIDTSKTGLKTKNRLKKEKLNAALVECDTKKLPYVSCYFDAVLSLYTIYHNTKQGIKQAIAETHRTLKKRGLILLIFHSKRSSKHGKGTKIEENTFIQENGPEKGILHHFVDEDEIQEFLEDFKILELQPEEYEIKEYLRSHLTVIATKE